MFFSPFAPNPEQTDVDLIILMADTLHAADLDGETAAMMRLQRARFAMGDIKRLTTRAIARAQSHRNALLPFAGEARMTGGDLAGGVGALVAILSLGCILDAETASAANAAPASAATSDGGLSLLVTTTLMIAVYLICELINDLPPNHVVQLPLFGEAENNPFDPWAIEQDFMRADREERFERLRAEQRACAGATAGSRQ